jgi:hypothetical protein
MIKLLSLQKIIIHEEEEKLVDKTTDDLTKEMDPE